MAGAARHYEDILAPRRQESSNFLWVSRQLKPRAAHKQPCASSPQLHKEQVLRSPKIQELLLSLSRKGASKAELEGRIASILDEIGYNRNIKLIRWLGLALTKICTRVCSHIYVSDVSTVKSSMGVCPVIFVPSHRSYADFILMSYVCFSEDLAVPAIAAGMDFHGMWGMGRVLRDTGAFFMRRSYNDDSLYWTTFKQYVYQIVTKGELPIEFFVEGTRSRSNKSLPPKYGLILMILKAFFLGEVSDIVFVPVNISYDRIMEERLFAFELLGIPKPKESTSAFFKSLSIVKEKFGTVHFTFASPISARAFFGSLDRSVHNLQPLHQQEITEDEKKLIPPLAHEIIHQQQKHAALTTFNLMAVVLTDNLSKGGAPLSVGRIVEEVLHLKGVLGALGAFVHEENVERGVREALKVHEDVVSLDEKDGVELVFDRIVFDQFDSGRLKAHGLSEGTISTSVPFIMLQIYVNPVLHYLVDVAILVVLLKFNRELDSDDLFGHYHFLRSLFSQEFISSREKTEFDAALENALQLNLVRIENGRHRSSTNEKLADIFSTCLDCFLYCYFVVCSTLLQVERNLVDEKTLLARVQEEVERSICDGSRFVHPYSLSLDSMNNCLNALSERGDLSKSRRGGSIVYEVDKARVVAVRDRLERCIPSSQNHPRKLHDVQLHLKTKL